MATLTRKLGYNSSLAQSYAAYTPMSGVTVTNLSISLTNNSQTAYATWTHVANAASYEVLWYYLVSTTSGSKWVAAANAYTNVGYANSATYSVPSGSLAVDVYVRPVSKTYTYQWQTYTESVWYDGSSSTGNFLDLQKHVDYIYTTHSETRAYFTAAAAHVQGGKPTEAAATPTAPDAPVLSLGTGNSVNVELSSTPGTYLKVWVGLYVDGAWGNHSGGKSYGPYGSGEVDVANVFTAADGHSYKVDARQQNTQLGSYSDFSSFSNELEMPPLTPANLAVTMLSGTAFQASWEKVGYTGDSYELRWAADPTGMTLDNPPSGVEVADVTGGATVYSGTLSPGTWYFCIRASGEGHSAWTDVKAVTLGLAPSAPTLGRLPSYIVQGQPIAVGWTYNNADGSAQAGYQVQRKVGSGDWSDVVSQTSGTASTASVPTTGVTAGSTVKVRVRTKGATGDWSDWTESGGILVEAPVTATIQVTQTTIPVKVSMSASSDVRSWHLVIASNGEASITEPDGSLGILPAGSVAFEGLLNYGDEDFDPRSVAAELDFADATFALGVSYTATLTVMTEHGLTDTDTDTFTPSWSTSAPVPNAVIPDPAGDHVAHIFPECRDWSSPQTSGGTTTYPLRTDVTLSVYRIDSDGHLLLVADGVSNTGSAEVIDPHPSFGTCYYRIAAKATDGSLGFVDVPCRCSCRSVVIQFETGLRGYSEEFFDGNGIIELPYDIRISEGYSGDAALVEFIGNADPTLYTGTQLGRTAQAQSTVITTDNADVISRVRMLAGNMSRAYYRDPSGLGFWAWVVPSLEWDGPVAVSASFAVTRIMGDYSGVV